MTTSLLALPLSSPIPDIGKKKRVLLIDASSAKRELRAEAMRKLGMDVDCAADISEARCWWKADLYNLVLVNLENERGHRAKFCDDVRSAIPRQQLAFLVGKPEYLADMPNPDAVGLMETDAEIASPNGMATAHNHNDDPAALPFGIMEASRRISAVRSASAARTTALRNRPTPPRDIEIQHARHVEAGHRFPSEIQKEEIL